MGEGCMAEVKVFGRGSCLIEVKVFGRGSPLAESDKRTFPLSFVECVQKEGADLVIFE